jgi:mannose-6-phosphate isomerase
MELYPLKFKPRYKERVWGGNKLATVLNRKTPQGKTIGESWELSSVAGNLSVVAEGFLKGNNIQELVEIYMGDLVGDAVYSRFGIEFPLLFKFIDSAERLSVQVHPDDATALQRHKAYGKTEMWYVLDASERSRIYVGFNRDASAEEFTRRVHDRSLLDIINCEQTHSGDVFFLPAGRIHAIGEDLLIAEIQQTSDVTYRIYDWGREDNPATRREMHTGLAADVIDYTRHDSYKTAYTDAANTVTELAKCSYFTANNLWLTQHMERDYSALDSFVVYMCLDGAASLHCEGAAPTSLVKGETALIPAVVDAVEIVPLSEVKLIEVYIEIA